MHLCVIGDSWAGNVSCNLGIFDRLFGDLGHGITNISSGGASNFGQLKKLEYEHLRKGARFDCVLWIHTECARDFTEFVSLQYGNDEHVRKSQFPAVGLHDLYADFGHIQLQNFRYAQDLFDNFSAPFIIIGGAGPVHVPLDSFTFVPWHLPSWNQEICKLDIMPWNCYTHHVVKTVEFGRYDKKQVMHELDGVDFLEKLMRKRKDLYPDGAHPSLNFYPDLVRRVHEKLLKL